VLLAELEKIRSQALSILAAYDQLTQILQQYPDRIGPSQDRSEPSRPGPEPGQSGQEPVELGAFVARVTEAIEDAFADTYPHDRQALERLYEVAQGDAETIVAFVRKLGDRHRKTGWKPETLHRWLLGVVRKQGIARIREEVQGFRSRPEDRNGPASHPVALVDQVVQSVLAEVGSPAEAAEGAAA